MKQGKNNVGWNTFTLKWIALLSMLIDHMGAVLFPEIPIFRIVGRMAFPIYAYLITEGFFYTHNIRNYMLRLGGLALISEIPFDLAFFGTPCYMGYQNVFFTLLIGLVVLYFYNRTTNKALQGLVLILGMIGSEILGTDYSSMGVALIFFFFWGRESMFVKTITTCCTILTWGSSIYALLGLIPIGLHNHKEGPKMKAWFYLFYPVHLLVLYMITLWR